MIFSTFQFLITTLLAAICARALSLSGGEVPIIAFVIPALWILPQGGVAGLALLAAMTSYALTLASQPFSLSVSVWMLFPLLMVIFSKRSSLAVILTTSLIVISLQVGIMLTQSSGKLGGSALLTFVQLLSIIVIWWSATHWKRSDKHSWWVLLFILPLWLAGLSYAILISLSIIGIIASFESLDRFKGFKWNKLLCWSLPAVGFAALVVTPNVDVPKPVFVVWICLLGTAWITDYMLRSMEESQQL
ncbi:hypothetical protein [Vibrio genomosp. F10]|uniref:hypothetical protein n=1 Tax=Vibrio genomosp. F10 TaxID=723171 RepID=UPI0003124746|nr:hypothetical protein [Vibrio genomosp. F10]OEF04966.1 hypothetical protein A1QI_09495 [Vibrio genomosp. F10 str. 9ZB36]